MPIIGQRVYPELEGAGTVNKHLKMFVDLCGDQAVTEKWLQDMIVLATYLRDIPDNSVSIEVFSSNGILLRRDGLSNLRLVPTSDEGGWTAEDYASLAGKFDCDLIVSNRKDSLIAQLASRSIQQRIEDFDEALEYCSIFLKGHDLPWSIQHPVWFMPWQAFHVLCDPDGLRASELFSQLSRLNLPADENECARSLLLNRIPHICFTRDKLLFYDQQRGYSRRRGWQRQEFLFEIGFFLTNYYLSIWGAIDQLALLVAGLFKIKAASPNEVSFRNEKFRRKLAEGAPRLAAVVSREIYLEWIGHMVKFRDHCAHRGTVELAMLVKEPELPPGDKELELEAMRTEFWSEMKATLPKEMFDVYVRMLKQRILLSKYERVTSDMSLFSSASSGSRTIFYPIARLKQDFKTLMLLTCDVFEEVISTLDRAAGKAS